MLESALLLLAPLPLQPALESQALLVGRPAPPIEARSWVREPEPTERSAERRARAGGMERRQGDLGNDAARAGDDLPGLHGWVVLVHALDWEAERLPELVVDLGRANADRGLIVRSIAPELDEEQALERMQAWGADWRVGLVAEDAEGIWAQWALASPGDVALVGRGGELAWIGMLDDEKSLLKALEELLPRPIVPALSPPSHAELDRALEKYWEGELSKASSLAESAAKGA